MSNNELEEIWCIRCSSNRFNTRKFSIVGIESFRGNQIKKDKELKHKVKFTTLDRQRRIIDHVNTFPTSASACTFFREIKGTSFTKPIIETLMEKKDNE